MDNKISSFLVNNRASVNHSWNDWGPFVGLQLSQYVHTRADIGSGTVCECMHAWLHMCDDNQLFTQLASEVQT